MRYAHGVRVLSAVVGATMAGHLSDTGRVLPRCLKGKTMLTVLNRLRTAARNQARYRETRDEIARMPLDVALDLGIYPGDAEEIARKAVWGR
jgi:uncharacterized protein YjiS (DUF1127 family)